MLRLCVPILLLSLCCSKTWAQDTLILYKKKDPAEEYKIPFGQYSIKVKSNTKKFNGLLVGQTDSSLVFRCRHNTRSVRRQIRRIYSETTDTLSQFRYPTINRDSLMLIAQKKAIDLLYPNEVSINFSELKVFKVDNRMRAEKQRLINALDISGMSALGVGVLGIPVAILLVPVSSIAWIVVPAWSLVISWVVVDLVLETKRLNLTRTWKIKRK